MHDRAIGAHHEICGAAHYLSNHVQPASGFAGVVRVAYHVAGAVTDKGLCVGTESGHDCFAGFAGRDWIALCIEDFEDDAFAHQQHLAVRGFVGGETNVAAAEFIGGGNAESFFDQFALVRIKRFAGGTYHLERGQPEPDAAFPRVCRQQSQATGVAVNAFGLESANGVDVGIHIGCRHVESIQHQLVEQPVPQRLDMAGFVQLDRRAPEIDFPVTHLDAPPAPCAYAPGGIRGLAQASIVKDQRLAAGTASIVFEGPAGNVAPDQLLDVASGVLLGHGGQAAQCFQGERRVAARLQTGGVNALGMPWAVLFRRLEQQL